MQAVGATRGWMINLVVRCNARVTDSRAWTYRCGEHQRISHGQRLCEKRRHGGDGLAWPLWALDQKYL